MTDREQAIPIGMLATRLHRATEADLFRRLADAGYTDLRMRHSMLFEALPAEGARVTTLAAQLGMTPQAMGELVDELESSGYVQRSGDPKDRRARLVMFTTKGRTAFDQAFVILSDMESAYAAKVGAAAYATARSVLAALAQALEDDAR
ncbi:MarR family winged helix-turn-helix transcriptional regulator [Microbacterium sp. NPDC087591]|uniref:MarR family winged helix-turn-helix transcriptional regulator n=1 Tax=Microbacterium sp. NPDC087591 TaxID=3364192 RepID=UPI0037FC0F3C